TRLSVGLGPALFQCSRPAIMRCNASQRSPSTPIAMRLPTRLTSSTRRPSSADGGGAVERSRNGPRIEIRSRQRPRIRSRSASTYTVTSGSSGTMSVPDHLFLAEPVDQDVAHQPDLIGKPQSFRGQVFAGPLVFGGIVADGQAVLAVGVDLPVAHHDRRQVPPLERADNHG